MTSSQKINPPILGIDWGKRRIGISISPDGAHVFPRKMLEINSETEGVEKIFDLVKREQIQTIVMGLPLTLRGEEGDMAKYVRTIGDQITKTSNVQVVYVDERATTKEAAKLPRAKMSHSEDSVVAMFLVETYLNQTKA